MFKSKYVTEFGSIALETQGEFEALIDEEKFEAFFGKLSPAERIIFIEFLHNAISYKVFMMNTRDMAQKKKGE